MDKILVDIRNEDEDIKNLFRNKDLVSVEELLGAIEELIFEVKELTKEKETEEPDAHDIWWDKQHGV